MKKKVPRQEKYKFQFCSSSFSSYVWGSHGCMRCCLTKTLFCIFGVQPRSPGVGMHRVCASIQKQMQGSGPGACARIEQNAAALRASMWLMVREEALREVRQGVVGSVGFKQASSTCSTCFPDATGRQRACAAYLDGCVYSGTCAGQVPSLKAGLLPEC